MSRYVRAKVEGGTYFLTLVTYRRRRLFHDDAARRCLHEAIEWSRSCEPFDLIDIVLLPDHLHLLICLPEEDFDFSSRMSRIKTEFTRRWSAAGGDDLPQSESRDRQGYRGNWQKRFWEHTVRDQADLTHCREYIYFNPVKHGLCRCPHDWPWSTFHRAVERGELRRDWRCICDGHTFEPPPEIPGTEMDS